MIHDDSFFLRNLMNSLPTGELSLWWKAPNQKTNLGVVHHSNSIPSLFLVFFFCFFCTLYQLLVLSSKSAVCCHITQSCSDYVTASHHSLQTFFMHCLESVIASDNSICTISFYTLLLVFWCIWVWFGFDRLIIMHFSYHMLSYQLSPFTIIVLINRFGSLT